MSRVKQRSERSLDTMRERFVGVTTELLAERSDISLVLADIGSGDFAATGASAAHPDRVVNVGIREQLLIGVAAGMAHEGFVPIVHTYAPFLVERAFEQLKLDLGHQGLRAVLVSVGASYDAAAAGRSHQAPEDVPLVATLPGWAVHVPGHPGEVESILRDAIDSGRNEYIRLSDETNEARYENGALVRRGSEGSPTLFAVGPTLDAVTEAVRDVDLTIIYLNEPVPFPDELLQRLSPDRLIIVEPYQEGTSASAIVRASGARRISLLSIGVPKIESRAYGRGSEHRRLYGLDSKGMRDRIEKYIR